MRTFFSSFFASVGVERFLRLLDERDDVAHLQDASGEPIRVELLQRVGLLADADVLDRLLEDAVDRERGAAAGVAIHLGEDDAGDVERLVESLGDADRVLPGHAVGHEEDLVGAHGITQADQLLHHVLVDLQPAGGVEDDHAIAGALGLLDAGLGDLDDVLRPAVGVDRDLEGGAQRLELVDGGRTVDVGGDEAGGASLRS